MPERGFSTDYWADTFVESLPLEGKLLYIYLWTNPHCNQAGLYEISLDRIAYETKLPVGRLSSLMEALEPKVKWYSEHNLVWVKNFIKRQSKSPKFLVAVAKSLSAIHNNGAISELLEYNLKRYSISIPYGYSIDSVVIPSTSNADLICSSANADEVVRVVKGKGESSSEETGILKGFGQLKGWQADEDDVLWLQGLRSEYPGFTLADFKACVDYNSGKPSPKHKGIWKNRFRNWMIKKQEFEKGGKAGRQLPTTKELEEEWKPKK